ncbi:BolA protein [Niveomyces insectorum RCEF 264]|uniref:BolA protein n=1 Tax=Niveomyces insectorum RCEF 264 TaxID=1081102 RepID=A0A167RWF2_9HYPO|nr:BolA protein [Niveomyces insectorum RCEF 264]
MLCAACCRRHSGLRRPVTAAAAAAVAAVVPRTATAAASFSTSLHAVRLPLPTRAPALAPTFGTAFVRHSSAAASATTPSTSAPSTASTTSTTSTTAAAETPSASTTALSKPPDLDPAESQVWDVLVAALAPTALSVRDISGGCGSMYGIEVSAAKFRGLSVLKQQRMVNAALGDLVKGWHGVQVTTRVP